MIHEAALATQVQTPILRTHCCCTTSADMASSGTSIDALDNLCSAEGCKVAHYCFGSNFVVNSHHHNFADSLDCKIGFHHNCCNLGPAIEDRHLPE